MMYLSSSLATMETSSGVLKIVMALGYKKPDLKLVYHQIFWMEDYLPAPLKLVDGGAN